MKKSFSKTIQELGLEKERVLSSISFGHITKDDVINGEYIISDAGFLYNPDTHFEYNGSIYDKEDGFYCDNKGQFLPFTQFDSVEVVTDSGVIQLWNNRDASDLPYFYEDRRYESSRAVYNSDIDLCVTEDTGEVMNTNYAYWSEEDECYYEYEENMPNRSSTYVDEYHHGGYEKFNFSSDPQRFIGFEIEKEDWEVKSSINISEFKRRTGFVWRKERDGSLDDESGFEVISPKFELDVDKIFEHIRGNEVLVDHINASKSYSCGGHIHLSVKGMTGKELFNHIKGYVPLFYSLYHRRSETNYCKAKPSSKLLSDNEKYQAVQILDNRIEFRIISAVKDVDNLEWRAKLMEIILDNPTSCFRKAYENILRSKTFGGHLKKAYPEKEKYEAFKKRIKEMTEKFENVNFNISKFKEAQDAADKNYEQEKRMLFYKSNVKRIQSLINSGGFMAKLVSKNPSDDEWMFIGRVAVPFEEGQVLKVIDFKRGCAFKIEGCEHYFPMTMFEIQQ